MATERERGEGQKRMMEVLIGHHKKNPISRTHQTSFRSEDPVEGFM